MRWAVDAATMRSIDQAALSYGISSLSLMERAGAAVARRVSAMAMPWEGVVILCGTGNNGGDGAVAARLLASRGFRPVMVIVGDAGKASPDAGVNFRRALEAGVRAVQVSGEGDLAQVEALLQSSDVVVDALLGTGARGAPRGLVASVVSLVAQAGRPVVSVDIPTGMDSDTGQAPGPVVRATVTVTMGLLKVGMLFHPGCTLVGEVEVADLGFPPPLTTSPAGGVQILDPGDLAWFLPSVPSTAHKGTCGKVVVVGGSPGMTGAVALCCRAALRTGAGLVYAAIPRSLNVILETMLPEVITLPLPEEDGFHGQRGLEALACFLGQVDVVVVGPGLGRRDGPCQMVRGLLDTWRGPTVVDADALFHLPSPMAFTSPVVLTPHPGEMARLSGLNVDSIEADRRGAATAEAVKRNAVVVLKGVPTVVADPHRCGVNLTGNAGMATGGSGDVLAGVVAGFLAQGAGPFEAALAAAFVHGLSADLVARRMPQASLIPSDLVEALPEALAVGGFGDRSRPVPWWKR